MSCHFQCCHKGVLPPMAHEKNTCYHMMSLKSRMSKIAIKLFFEKVMFLGCFVFQVTGHKISKRVREENKDILESFEENNIEG